MLLKTHPQVEVIPVLETVPQLVAALGGLAGCGSIWAALVSSDKKSQPGMSISAMSSVTVQGELVLVEAAAGGWNLSATQLGSMMSSIAVRVERWLASISEDILVRVVGLRLGSLVISLEGSFEALLCLQLGLRGRFGRRLTLPDPVGSLKVTPGGLRLQTPRARCYRPGPTIWRAEGAGASMEVLAAKLFAAVGHELAPVGGNTPPPPGPTELELHRAVSVANLKSVPSPPPAPPASRFFRRSPYVVSREHVFASAPNFSSVNALWRLLTRTIGEGGILAAPFAFHQPGQLVAGKALPLYRLTSFPLCLHLHHPSVMQGEPVVVKRPAGTVLPG